MGKSPTKTIETQANHFFASILAFIKLEKLTLRLQRLPGWCTWAERRREATFCGSSLLMLFIRRRSARSKTRLQLSRLCNVYTNPETALGIGHFRLKAQLYLRGLKAMHYALNKMTA